MKPSTLRSLQALRKLWKDQGFSFTPEQELRYQTLLTVRRGQVSDWVAQGKVA